MLCQDARVFDSMMAAGTPCPYGGQIGDKAKAMWLANPTEAPENTKLRRDAIKKAEAVETEAKDGEWPGPEYPE